MSDDKMTFYIILLLIVLASVVVSVVASLVQALVNYFPLGLYLIKGLTVIVQKTIKTAHMITIIYNYVPSIFLFSGETFSFDSLNYENHLKYLEINL